MIDWIWLDERIGQLPEYAWSAIKNGWSNYSTFFSRFNVSGVGKFFAEIFSESMTLGTAGFMALLMFAMPAFEEINETWRTTGQFSVTFLDRYGNEIGRRGVLQSDAVPLDEIPDHMIKSALATEDRRFYAHFGIDVLGTFRALINNIRNESVQGGSSITQQLAKNLFLTPERSLERKIKEAFLAMWLEVNLSKDEILKMYFDRAYMGGGAFGVEAAAQYYFGKSIRDVNLAEAALLGGLFKAPTTYAPHNNPAKSRERTSEVLTNLVQAGFMTEGQVHGARLKPARIKERPQIYTPDYFLDWAFSEVKRLMEDKDNYVLTVKTTVDVNLQRTGEEIVKNMIRKFRRAKRIGAGAMVSMDTDGAVRMIVGGTNYGRSQFNRATQSKRQPGSSIKPYVYLTGIQHGLKPRTRIALAPTRCGRWSPRNYSGGRTSGSVPMSFALKKSINTVAVRIAQKYGRKKVIANLRKAGITHIKPTCSMALGDQGITLMQHTSGYASFANGGMRARAYGVTEIRDSSGNLLYSREKNEPPAERIFKEKHVAYLNSMLGNVVIPGGTARRAGLDFTTAAGKTGTTSSYRDAWFMGYTGKYVTGVWYGNDNYRPTNRLTGGNVPAMTWHEYMSRAHLNPDIPKIPGLRIHPQQAANVRRMKARRKKNPNLSSTISAVRGLPKKTESVLDAITKMMKDAKPLSAAKNRNRASLAPATISTP